MVNHCKFGIIEHINVDNALSHRNKSLKGSFLQKSLLSFNISFDFNPEIKYCNYYLNNPRNITSKIKIAKYKEWN